MIFKWQNRVKHLHRILDTAIGGTSSGPPNASVVAASCAPSRDPEPVAVQSDVLRFPAGMRTQIHGMAFHETHEIGLPHANFRTLILKPDSRHHKMANKTRPSSS